MEFAIVVITPWHWIALCLVLLAAEAMTGSSYLLWPAAAAGVTSLLALVMPGDWPLQTAFFAGAAIVLTIYGRRIVRGRWLAPNDVETLNERGAQLVGAVGEAAGDFSHGVGSIRLGDTIWRAQTLEDVHAGDAIVVTGVHGATLLVRKAD